MRRLLALPLLTLLALGGGAGAGRPLAPAARPAIAAQPAGAGTPAAHWQHWWEGYFAQPQQLHRRHPARWRGATGVSGYLVVPRLASAGYIGTSTWLGIQDALAGSPLVQAGVWLYPPGVGHDRAWVATCGTCVGRAAPAGDTVRAGDHMYFVIAWGGGDHWTATVRNLTARWTWVDQVSYRPVAWGEGVWAVEYGPATFAGGGFRWWWPTTTWRGATSPAALYGEALAGGGGEGCLSIAARTSFTIRQESSRWRRRAPPSTGRMGGFFPQRPLACAYEQDRDQVQRWKDEELRHPGRQADAEVGPSLRCRGCTARRPSLPYQLPVARSDPHWATNQPATLAQHDLRSLPAVTVNNLSYSTLRARTTRVSFELSARRPHPGSAHDISQKALDTLMGLAASYYWTVSIQEGPPPVGGA